MNVVFMLTVPDPFYQMSEVGLGIGYTSKQTEIDRLLEGRETLRCYIDALN